MNDAIEVRDRDGFICVIRKEPIDIPKTTGLPTYRNAIGEHILRKAEFKQPKKGKYSFKSEKIQYETEYAEKFWVNKAWRAMCHGIDWNSKSEFAKKGSTKKIRHLKRIAIAMKVQTDDFGNKMTIDTLSGDQNSKMYTIIDTPEEFDRWMHRLWLMAYKPDSIKQYLEIAKKNGYFSIGYITKAVFLYDDKSYDCIQGNPLQVEDILGFKFNDKGHIIWRN